MKNKSKSTIKRFKTGPTKKARRATLGSAQYRSQEVQMPLSLMEHLFDTTSGIGFETEDEADYRMAKERYNKEILKRIKKVRLTDRQKEVLSLMYGKTALNYRETAECLGVIVTTVQEIRDAAFKKIRKAIIYDFKQDEELL